MREPIYHKTGRPFRIISLANGYWVAQERVTEQGGINRTDRAPHFDPWQNVARPGTQDQALATMYARSPAS